jgi:erythronate-4-phosphate dehydrogenase
MLTILADENIPAVEYYAGSLGAVKLVNGRSLQSAQLAGVDVLLVRSVTRVDEALLGDCAVRFVGTATSGVDHIDRDYLRQRGIDFAYAPGSNANSVVEYVLTAIAVSGDALERLLAGGRVGIIGYGVIGKAVAARLRALDIDYRVYDPWLAPSDISKPAELSAVMACDVVTLHPELTRAQPWPSYHLVDAAALGKLNRGSLLINASRGPVVDNQALLELLTRGGGPATVLDVWEGEPAISHALLQQVNLGTPHIAGYSLDGKLLATRMLCAAMANRLGLAWQAPSSPAGEPPLLQLPCAQAGAALVRQLLLARYDITLDDARLREVTLCRGRGQAAAAFDLLRRDYPQRRELLGSRVQGPGFSVADISLLKGLGCIVQTGGQLS